MAEAKLGQASSLKTLIMILHRIVLKICEFLQTLRMDNFELGNNLGMATSIFLMLVKAGCKAQKSFRAFSDQLETRLLFHR